MVSANCQEGLIKCAQIPKQVKEWEDQQPNSRPGRPLWKSSQKASMHGDFVQFTWNPVQYTDVYGPAKCLLVSNPISLLRYLYVYVCV
jgi:hypothetical protein